MRFFVDGVSHAVPRSLRCSPHTDDSTTSVGFMGSRIDAMGPLIFERKFEVDTLSKYDCDRANDRVHV